MAGSGKRRRQLSDGYSFADFRAQATVRGLFGHRDVRIVRLDRRKRRVRDLPSAGFRIVLELERRRVACRICDSVKLERLEFLSDNPHFTKHFAFYVGRRCGQASIRDVAKGLKLDWDTVKTLETQYMRAQIECAGAPTPEAIGIDEIAIRKGHTYRSWSATWFASGQSGLVETTAQRSAWLSSTPGWDPRRPARSGSS